MNRKHCNTVSIGPECYNHWATEEMRCMYEACTVNQRYEEVLGEYAKKQQMRQNSCDMCAKYKAELQRNLYSKNYGLVGMGLIPTRSADSQQKHTTHTNCCIYTLLPPDDGQLASPKHVEV
jgi:hypothetical protein